MSPATPPPAYGAIVLVAGLLDPNGVNPKDRPCVVVTPPAEAGGGSQVVVAISTQVPDPLPDDYVPLPWHRAGHPRTGLNRRNAAIGRWLDLVEDSRIIRRIGMVPHRRMLELALIIERLYPTDDEPTGEP